MSDILELIFEYRRLLAEREHRGPELEQQLIDRLRALERLFGADPEDRQHQSRRRFARCDCLLPATMRIGERIEPVDIVNVGAGGVRVEPAPVLKHGERAHIRIVSEDRLMYIYQVEATWSVRSHHCSSMGLPFVGVPKQVLL